jgi:hypothetical protein
MPLFTWDPVPTFVARQINTLDDVDLWLGEMEAAGLFGPKDGWLFSDFSAAPIEGDEARFRFEYTITSDVDGTSRHREDVEFGRWGIANSLYSINLPWFESEENFTRRFQPFHGLVEPEA